MKTPLCVGPMVGANCCGKVTADVLMRELDYGAFAMSVRGRRTSQREETRFYTASGPGKYRPIKPLHAVCGQVLFLCSRGVAGVSPTLLQLYSGESLLWRKPTLAESYSH